MLDCCCTEYYAGTRHLPQLELITEQKLLASRNPCHNISDWSHLWIFTKKYTIKNSGSRHMQLQSNKPENSYESNLKTRHALWEFSRRFRRSAAVNVTCVTERYVRQTSTVTDRTCRLYRAPAASPTEYWRGRRSALIGGTIAGRQQLHAAPQRSPGRPGPSTPDSAVFMTEHRRAFSRRAHIIVVRVFRRRSGMFQLQVTGRRSSRHLSAPSIL